MVIGKIAFGVKVLPHLPRSVQLHKVNETQPQRGGFSKCSQVRNSHLAQGIQNQRNDHASGNSNLGKSPHSMGVTATHGRGAGCAKYGCEMEHDALEENGWNLLNGCAAPYQKDALDTDVSNGCIDLDKLEHEVDDDGLHTDLVNNRTVQPAIQLGKVDLRIGSDSDLPHMEEDGCDRGGLKLGESTKGESGVEESTQAIWMEDGILASEAIKADAEVSRIRHSDNVHSLSQSASQVQRRKSGHNGHPIPAARKNASQRWSVQLQNVEKCIAESLLTGNQPQYVSQHISQSALKSNLPVHDVDYLATSSSLSQNHVFYQNELVIVKPSPTLPLASVSRYHDNHDASLSSNTPMVECGMGFGAELQGKSSHEALVRVQDTEIQLLENVKKCVLHRIKIDRDYSNALSNMVAMAQKFENSEFQSPIFEAWNTIINQTEAINTLLEKNANQLCLKTLDKIIHLINEKKATRKAYIEERQRLEIEFAKLQEEVQKLKGEYERSLEKAVHDKARYEDLYMKGKPGSKFEDAKIRFVKSTNKLHKVHNSYLIALKEVNLHQQHYLNTTLPGLLDFQQSVQQVMIRQFKEILLEYEECTDTSHEEFAKCHRQMLRNINLVNSVTEYTTFLQKSKSDQLKPAKFEFDKSLLDPYTGTLVCNQLAVDDLTIDSLQLSCASFDDKANSIKNQHDERNRKLKELEKEMEKLAQQQERDSITQTSYDTHERACETLRRELAEMKCNEAKYRKLHEFLNPLIENPDEVPAGLDLPDIGKDVMATSSTNYSKLESIKSTLLSPFRKTPASPSSPPPERDQDYNEMVSKKPSGVPVLPMNNSHSGSSTASEGAANLPRSTSGTSNMSENYQQLSMAKRMTSVVQGLSRSSGSLPITNYSPKSRKAAARANTHKPSPAHGNTLLIQMTLNPNRKIAEEDWFHGVLPRDEVIRLLKEDGDYLVRESRNRKTNEIQYVLSVMWSGHKHFIIQGEDGKWRFEGDSFPTIQELIIHQHKSGKPVTHKSKALLKNPIVRERWELNNDDIDITENIGKGNFGEVHRGFYRSMDMEVAVKTCKETVSDDMTKKFLQEGRILMQYDHPNIVKFIGIAAQRQPIMIVMEYVPGGALLSFLRKEGQSQTVKQMSTMCENAAAGMDYLEKKNCIHRDLAARNCLVGKDNVIKISDFGMSREEEEYTVSQGLNQIPIKWTAPEALHFGRYTSLCDVWSYGVLMWEVFSCGATPYPGLSNNQAREKIDNGYRMPKPGVAPQNIYDLMLRCWEGDPEKRPHFEEVHSDLQRILRTL